MGTSFFREGRSPSRSLSAGADDVPAPGGRCRHVLIAGASVQGGGSVGPRTTPLIQHGEVLRFACLGVQHRIDIPNWLHAEGRRGAPPSRPATTQRSNVSVWLSPSATSKPVGPERGEPVEAALRHVALDRGELEGQRRDGPRQPGEHAILEALHIDLDEGRAAVVAMSASRVSARHGDGVVPDLALPAAGAVGGARRNPSDAVETVGLALLTWSVSVPSRRADGGSQQRHAGVAAVDAAGSPAPARAAAPARPRARRGGGSEAIRSPTWAPMSKARSPALHEARIERIHGRGRAPGRR